MYIELLTEWLTRRSHNRDCIIPLKRHYFM